MKIKILITLLIAMLALPAPILAQDGDGGTRSIFTLGAGSRAIAMGGAYTAIGSDPAALYYNPAAMKLNPYPAVLLNHIQLFSGFSDANYDFLGVVYPTMSVGAFGLGLMTAGTGGIREFDAFSRELGEFSYRESQAVLAYAFDLPWRFLGKFTLGSSVKILNQRVGDYSDTGTGCDFGLLYRQDLVKGLVLGCNVQDIIGAETKLVSENDKVYRTMMLGAGYTRSFANGSALTLALQMDLPERADADLRFGAEYDYKGKVALRAGFDSESFTVGIGFGWGRYRGDYGFFTREEAGSSHPFTIVTRIGTPLEEKIRAEEERRRKEAEERMSRIFAQRVKDHLDAAKKLRSEGQLEKSLDEFKIVLEYDPVNEEASSMMEEVRAEISRIQRDKMAQEEKSLLIGQHFDLGLRYYSNNEYILARAEWKNVLELDPNNKDAADYLDRTQQKLDEQMAQHKDNAMAYEKDGKLAAALAEWNLVRVIDPENPEALAASERISGRLEEIDRNYRAARHRLRTIDIFEDALKSYSEGKYEDAASKLEQVLRLQPDHKEARDLLARVRRKLTPLTDEDRENIRQLFIDGMKLFNLKDYSGAIDTWNKILDIDPDNESVRKNIEDARHRLEKIE